ncbi:hypothetical protein WL75_04665 [Burkholderia ubonensis]|nr:hypothetical protein WK51_17935 [Burkholderia ubonensis]KWE29239.1 hypothetical protein WL75_04665 [Burkholderia ubonensis]OJA78764.1 hypothetical protein BGV48_34100 [Burkholderia ubonensis]
MDQRITKATLTNAGFDHCVPLCIAQLGNELQKFRVIYNIILQDNRVGVLDFVWFDSANYSILTGSLIV